MAEVTDDDARQGVQPPERFPGGVDSIGDEEKYGDIPDAPLIPDLDSDSNPATDDIPDELDEPEESQEEPTSDGASDPGEGDPGLMGDADEHDGPDPAEEVRESDPNAGGPGSLAGGMGVSSERTEPSGMLADTGDPVTNATKDTSPQETDPDAVPEQATGGPETNPEGIEPKAGYSSRDPRSD